ncbi:MAG: prepilin-type N-terminal cleavage/methylation domain-containing protein [Acidimicrobiia bacterium]|nr:prepilin-type N-terminal cleavage/methylation domain-containing protein [Acidimicrobiia bacterium]
MTNRASRNRASRGDRGFSLVELMVVILIIGILIGIAIPVWYSVRQRTQDRAAQSELRTAAGAQMAWYGGAQMFTANPVELASMESALDFVAAPSTDPQEVSLFLDPVAPWPGATVIMGSRSNTGRCFYLRLTHDSSLRFGSTGYQAVCDVNAAAAAWTDSW